jgi:hypothetical protein
MRMIGLVPFFFLAACAAEPDCDFAPPLSGGPGEYTDSPPVPGVIEAWTPEKITVRTTGDRPQELSVSLPTTTVDVGTDDAVGVAVMIEVFHNLDDCFESEESCEPGILNARILSEDGVLVFSAGDAGGSGAVPVEGGASCTYLGAAVLPGQTTLASDDGEIVSRSGEEHLLVVEGQKYVVQNVASYVDGLTPVSMVAQRVVFPLN